MLIYDKLKIINMAMGAYPNAMDIHQKILVFDHYDIKALQESIDFIKKGKVGCKTYLGLKI